MNENQFDTMLRSALLEAQARRWQSVTDSGPELVWTPARQRIMDRVLADPLGYGKRVARPLWRRALGRVGQVAACLLLAGSMTLAVSPTARAWAVKAAQIVVEWVSESTHFIFQGAATEELGVWNLGHVPDGYQEKESFEFSNGTAKRFENTEGTPLYFDYTLVSQGGMLDFDNEHSDYAELELNGQPAHLFCSNTEGKPSSLIWFDDTGEVAFQIIAHENPEEIITMAESVTQQDQRPSSLG